MVAQLGQFAATVLNHFAVSPGAEAGPEFRLLDHQTKSDEAHEFECELVGRVVGQERALRTLAQIYQVYQAGLNTPGRPIERLLFLGPTGTGKTRSVEAAAEVLFGNPNAFVRIDCAEFQHPHEISKLIGAPPGYLGHRGTPPMSSQESLDSYQTERTKLSLVLFDEIEKASDALCGDVLLTDLGKEEDSLVFMKRQRTAVLPEFDTYDFRFDQMSRYRAVAGAAR